MKINVALLFGGVSSEHEVSCRSVASVAENIDREKYNILMLGITKEGEWQYYNGPIGLVKENRWENTAYTCPAFLSPDRATHGIIFNHDNRMTTRRIDVAFPVLHGKNGEDGTMQGFLEIAGIPYVGCGVLASAVCMDKEICHTVLANAGVPQVKWLTFFCGCDPAGAAEEVGAKLGWPVFVKPANAGSSVGVTKVKKPADLKAALELAFKHDHKVVVEEAVKNPIEIECSVLGNEDPIAAGPGEIDPGEEFYTYNAKYNNAGSQLYIPARIPEEIAAEVREIAKKAYRVLGCRGMARVDFLIDGNTKKIYLNEPNTLPGFTDISMYPKMLVASGMGYPELIDRLLELAMEP